MNKYLRLSLLVVLVGAAGIALFWSGVNTGKAGSGVFDSYPIGMMDSYGWMPSSNSGMYGNINFSPNVPEDPEPGDPYKYPCQTERSKTGDWFNSMIGGNGMMGGLGMMGGFGNGLNADVDPLSLTQAREILEDYLLNLGDEDLEVGEVMIFDNHAYAQIIEKSTGIGAMEVLVDPVSLNIYPEFGPNMMWNLKYGMMSGYDGNTMMDGFGMMGRGFGGMMGGYGMMEGYGQSGTESDAGEISSMNVTPDQAVEYAQRYLDKNIPGAEADDHADPFYGYYTLHVLGDGEVEGMLSVNGYTGQVFLHSWHGDFIEMSESH